MLWWALACGYGFVACAVAGAVHGDIKMKIKLEAEENKKDQVKKYGEVRNKPNESFWTDGKNFFLVWFAGLIWPLFLIGLIGSSVYQRRLRSAETKLAIEAEKNALLKQLLEQNKSEVNDGLCNKDDVELSYLSE